MYALIDCNNFYASCERAFAPTLNGSPIVILSNNDGCVIARSNEAKALGIPMGAPAFQYKKIFQQYGVKVFSSNFTLYGDLSHRVMNVLQGFTPEMEIYSIDEAFLRFRGFDEDLVEYGHEMREKVLQCTRIPVSIGFAPTKALSKVANRIAKKFPEKTKGVYVIDTEEKRIKALKWLSIEDVWGIGNRTAKKLYKINVHNAFEFTQFSDAYVQKQYSVVLLRLKKELEGTPVLLLDDIKPKKNIATTRTFSKDLYELSDIRERVSAFASSCAEKLRRQKSACGHLMVFVRTNRHKEGIQYSKSHVIKLPYASNTDFTVSEYALKALDIIFKKGFGYKKAGVIVMDFAPENEYQTNLFEEEDPKYKPLVSVMDKINDKYGQKLLKIGTQDPQKRWIMRQDQLSQKYTTKWSELLEVK